MNEVDELSELRSLLERDSMASLRLIWLAAQVQRLVRRSVARDDGSQQRVSLVRQIIRQKRRASA